jgi:hypothetical protein
MVDRGLLEKREEGRDIAKKKREEGRRKWHELTRDGNVGNGGDDLAIKLSSCN